MLHQLREHAENASLGYVLSVNLGVLGISFTDAEQALKLTLLVVSVMFTSASLYYKIKNKGL